MRRKKRRKRKKTKPEEGSTSSLRSLTRRQSLTWALRPGESTAPQPQPSLSLTSYSRFCCWLPSAGGKNPRSHTHAFSLTQHTPTHFLLKYLLTSRLYDLSSRDDKNDRSEGKRSGQLFYPSFLLSFILFLLLGKRVCYRYSCLFIRESLSEWDSPPESFESHRRFTTPRTDSSRR